MLQYVTMPIEILELPNLNIQEKFILSLAKTLNQGCFLSNQQIATMLGISKSRVSHIISKLVKDGYIDITLEYKPNSKEVAKRTITFKEVIKKVQEAVKRAVSKAKELKADYVPVSKTVGTEKVQQQTLGQKFYTKPERAFNKTYSHNWDLDAMDKRELDHQQSKYRNESIEQMQERLEKTRQKNIR